MKSRKLEEVDTTGVVMFHQDLSIVPSLTIVVGNPGHLAHRCVSTHSMFCDVRERMFDLRVEEWNWDGLGRPRSTYYWATPRRVPGRKGKLYPVRGYCFQWKPCKRELTAWAIEDPKTKVTTTLWPKIASELSGRLRKCVTS